MRICDSARGYCCFIEGEIFGGDMVLEEHLCSYIFVQLCISFANGMLVEMLHYFRYEFVLYQKVLAFLVEV